MASEPAEKKSADLTGKQAAVKQELMVAGNQAFDSDDFQRALDCYHRASLVDGKDHAIWNALGMTYANLEFIREAWRSYKLSLQCSPDNLDTLWYAGEFLANVEDLQMAMIVLTRYLELEVDPERRKEAETLISDIREQAGTKEEDFPGFRDPEIDPIEDDSEGEEFDGFEIEGEELESEEVEDDLDDEFHEGDDELTFEDGEQFVASLSLELTTMESKCTNCRIMIPQDAPYCYSCNAPHFYD